MTSPPDDLNPKATMLLVEDNDDDVFMIRRALEGVTFVKNIRVVCNGIEALEYLRGEGKYAGKKCTKPDLILLDLNMDQMNGFELFEELKKDRSLAGIPVIALTSSDSYLDRDKAYALGMNDYLLKPANPGDFLHTIREVERRLVNLRKA